MNWRTVAADAAIIPLGHWNDLPETVNYKGPVRIGDSYGRLTVVDGPRLRQYSTQRNSCFLCSCSCDPSRFSIVMGVNLTGGLSGSCGCRIAEAARGRPSIKKRYVYTLEGGREMTIIDIAEEAGVCVSTIRGRFRRGESPDEALQGDRPRGVQVAVGDLNLTISEWARHTGITRQGMHLRYKKFKAGKITPEDFAAQGHLR